MEECPTVKTTGGLVKGKISKATDPSAKPVYNFLGIPYGKSPVGKLRFLAPEKVEAWEGTFEAVHTYKLCPQEVSVAFAYDELIPFKNSLNHDGNCSDENCLMLNLFTPECNKNAKLPVMVWLTGGHYQRNFGGRRNGTPLAGMNDVLIVVPNFRVNVFGFLSLGKDSCCPGNAALGDVILSLKWIQENIGAFGGDPENVTLFGESSGSGMTHLLMMSPPAKGLFHKAILMSGSATSPFLFDDTNQVARDIFLKGVGIDAGSMNDEDILEKLQEMPVDKILAGLKQLDGKATILPTIDGHVIPNNPQNLIQTGHVHRIPLMIGCTNSEGSGMLSMRLVPGYNEGLNEEVAKKIFIDTFQKIYQAPNEKGEAAFKALKDVYMKNIDPDSPLKYSQLHGEAFSDAIFVIPSVLTAKAHATMKLPTYFYHMTQRPEFNHSPTNGPDVRKRPYFVKCDHADDLHFLWGVPFEEGELSGGAYFTDDEVELSRTVMKYFTNFAKSGNPNQPEKVSSEWPPYSSGSDSSHMELKIPLKEESNLAHDKLVFFTHTLPKIAQS